MSVPESTQQSVPMVALSWGEVVDKITILEIKQQRLSSTEAIDNVRRELAALNKVVETDLVREREFVLLTSNSGIAEWLDRRLVDRAAHSTLVGVFRGLRVYRFRMDGL